LTIAVIIAGIGIFIWDSKRGLIMRKFAYAAVFATAISAPVLAGALMDHSAVSVLGAPCSNPCAKGGANPANPGNAQGGHSVITVPPPVGGTNSTTVTLSGTQAVPGGQASGRRVSDSNNDALDSSQSGNATKGNGHCTGPGC
jgi:hypothetical protein